MINRLDHLVLTVASIEVSIAFYRDALGMQPVTFGAGRHALSFGRSKINLHQKGHEFEPKALAPTPGSADLCFIASPIPPAATCRSTRSGTLSAWNSVSPWRR